MPQASTFERYQFITARQTPKPPEHQLITHASPKASQGKAKH
jgi:hypothetical protein